MWSYEKRLQYPVKITNPNPKIAQVIISQFGGPDGELAASQRYLSQRYTMPYREVAGLLTDIGTEELAHMEMICAIVHQLTRNLTPEQIMESGFEKYYVDHTLALWPQAAGGTPFTATVFQSKGDPITDLHEDMAADGAILSEQRLIQKFMGLKSPVNFNRNVPCSRNPPADRDIVNQDFHDFTVQVFQVGILFDHLTAVIASRLFFLDFG